MKGLLSVSGAFAVAMLVAGSAFAQGQDGEGRGRGRDRGRQGGKDCKNCENCGKDGKPGRPKFEKPPLSEIDTDGDGKVSDAEREAFKEKMHEQFKAKARARVLEHFDDNKDGVLSGEELNKVARALMHARSGKGRGRPGSGGNGQGHQGPPGWSNAGGNHDDDGDRQGPPGHSNAGGRRRRGRPSDDDAE